MRALRDVFGAALVELGRRDPRIVVLDGDLATSTRVTLFREAFPDRFIQVGIAEQNMVGIAAGLASLGKIPVVSSFAVFLSKRALDQVTISVAHTGANVKLIGAYTGLLTGHTGATHQAVQDTAIMRATPGMVVVDPADARECASCLEVVINHAGPVYFRLTRDAWPDVSPPDYQFRLGVACEVRPGTDVTVIAGGPLVSESILAARRLEQDGISVRVVNMASIKPLDMDAIVRASRETGAIVTAENHSIYGGLGSAVAEAVSSEHPCPVIRVGIKDVLGETGTNEELLTKYEMDSGAIERAARRALAFKRIG
ncbi:MAG: transketolase family protein [Chloroflexi bacterium]|nr:transketolase family protein [Chloroflexota bacterium]